MVEQEAARGGRVGTTPRILLASTNAGKLAEMQRVLSGHLPDVRVLGLADVEPYAEPVEDQATFEGNALLKAWAGFSVTGLPTLADDSGICVDALNGMPGVLSARWAGSRKSDEANNALLLDQLSDVPDERRGAHFVCAVAFVYPTAEAAGELVVEGRMDGRVGREVRGSGGFGYDVVFEADAFPGRTTAQLTREEKDSVSHRGQALRAIVPQVAAILGGSRSD